MTEFCVVCWNRMANRSVYLSFLSVSNMYHGWFKTDRYVYSWCPTVWDHIENLEFETFFKNINKKKVIKSAHHGSKNVEIYWQTLRKVKFRAHKLFIRPVFSKCHHCESVIKFLYFWTHGVLTLSLFPALNNFCLISHFEQSASDVYTFVLCLLKYNKVKKMF